MALGGAPGVVEAGAVVADRQHRGAVLHAEPQAHRGRVGVLGDVRERLPRHLQEHALLLRGEEHRGTDLHGRVDPPLGQRVREPGQGLRQSQGEQVRGVQGGGDPAQGAEAALQDRPGPAQRAALLRDVSRHLLGLQGVGQAGQVLDHVVVQVPGDPHPLQLGGVHGVLEQLCAGRPVVLDPAGQTHRRGELRQLEQRQGQQQRRRHAHEHRALLVPHDRVVVVRLEDQLLAAGGDEPHVDLDQLPRAGLVGVLRRLLVLDGGDPLAPGHEVLVPRGRAVVLPHELVLVGVDDRALIVPDLDPVDGPVVEPGLHPHVQLGRGGRVAREQVVGDQGRHGVGGQPLGDAQDVLHGVLLGDGPDPPGGGHGGDEQHHESREQEPANGGPHLGPVGRRGRRGQRPVVEDDRSPRVGAAHVREQASHDRTVSRPSLEATATASSWEWAPSLTRIVFT